MAGYLSLSMVEKEYTGTKRRKEMEFSFPETPIKETQVAPDSFQLDNNNKNLLVSVKGVIGSDTRRIINNPHKVSYAQCVGKVVAYFTINGEVVEKQSTAFSFASNWLFTVGTNIYNIAEHTFADKVLYYPALGGDIDHPPFAPVTVTNAYIHHTITTLTDIDTQSSYNFAFLKLDEKADKPKGFLGFRYQYTEYDGESTMLVGYPNDLPTDAGQDSKGNYMYRGMGKISSSLYSFLYHQADASEGEEGAPLYVTWDANGFVVIGMNAYEGDNKNIAIRVSRLIYGAMQMIRDGGMATVRYKQPAKPDVASFDNISTVLNAIGKLGELYKRYHIETYGEVSPMRSTVVGICNYMRHYRYGGALWAGALLDPIDSVFVAYVEKNGSAIKEELEPYIGNDKEDLRDDGNGKIDLAHFIATLEGYVGLTPAPDFWTGWGADLATGMSDTTNQLAAIGEENIDNYLVTLTAYSIIGSESSQCNYSDFCCDFDAIKISELINEKENDPDYDCNNPTGLELKQIMQEYYTNYYQKRFEYVLKDLNCAVDVNYTELYNQILAKMTGVDESVLLISFGKNPSETVIQNCCDAFTRYLLCEI